MKAPDSNVQDLESAIADDEGIIGEWGGKGKMSKAVGDSSGPALFPDDTGEGYFFLGEGVGNRTADRPMLGVGAESEATNS